MATGGHFGFWLLTNSAAIFARVMGAKYFLNTSKSSNQVSNLTMLSVITGPPDCTQLAEGNTSSTSQVWPVFDRLHKCVCVPYTQLSAHAQLLPCAPALWGLMNSDLEMTKNNTALHLNNCYYVHHDLDMASLTYFPTYVYLSSYLKFKFTHINSHTHTYTHT